MMISHFLIDIFFCSILDNQLVFWYHFVHKSYMLDSMFLIALICFVFYTNGVDKHEDISTRLIFYTTHQFKSSRTIDCEPAKWDNFGWILNRVIVPIVFNITHTHTSSPSSKCMYECIKLEMRVSKKYQHRMRIENFFLVAYTRRWFHLVLGCFVYPNLSMTLNRPWECKNEQPMLLLFCPRKLVFIWNFFKYIVFYFIRKIMT